MSKLKVKVTRNLRRTLLRGQPWVYRQAIEIPKGIDRAQLCQVLDSKGELGWAIYDPHAPLSLRFISNEKGPPNQQLFAKRFGRALELRQHLNRGETNAYRLFNGEGDLLPGLVCDIYDSVAVVQFDGTGPTEFWDSEFIAKWLLENTGCKSIVEKNRRSKERSIEQIAGEPAPNEITVRENKALFKVNLEKGQKTGFFLDQRDNRHYIRQVARGKSLLNLFSYTGGFSVNAGLGGARKVASLDVSRGAIDQATENWALNGLDPSLHEGLCVDVFDYLKDAKEKWDHIIVDPPSMGHSEKDKERAKLKYIEAFAAAAKQVADQGHLSVSSCSSHISFQDFFEIIQESISQSRRRGQVLRVSGQGPDHPFPNEGHELRYLKFVHLALY